MATPTRTSRYGSTPTARPAGTPQAAERSELPRNPGMPLDLGWVRDVRINRSAVERRAATIPTRRSVKTAWQAGWLLRAITLIDLTTLQGDDTPGRVLRLCGKARRPVRKDLLDDLGVGDLDLRVAAVCVYHAFVETAVRALEGSDIPVAAVSTGFPAGLSPLSQRIAEIEASVAAGARESDSASTPAPARGGEGPRARRRAPPGEGDPSPRATSARSGKWHGRASWQ